VPRRRVRATINDWSLKVHVDLGAPNSQLRERRWSDLGLAQVPFTATLVDEAGESRAVTRGARGWVSLPGPVPLTELTFVPYVEARWPDDLLDGALGLDLLADRAVAVHGDTLHLTLAEKVEPAARIARWGSPAVSGCASAPACTTVGLVTPKAPGSDELAAAEAALRVAETSGVGVDQAKHDLDVAKQQAATLAEKVDLRPALTVTRTEEVAGYGYELTLAPFLDDGAPIHLPLLVVVLPKGVTRLTQLIDERYRDTVLAVVDVSPFPRACERPAGCVYLTDQ
jgi:hypothetical protein